MDLELKQQLQALLQQAEEQYNPEQNLEEDMDDEEYDYDDIANDPVKQLESIIKKKPADSDDDCYFVLVIGDPKDKGNEEIETLKLNALQNTKKQTGKLQPKSETPTLDIKVGDIEPLPEPEPIEHLNEPLEEFNEKSQNHFENTIDSFLVSNTKIPVNVPARILENVEKIQVNDGNYNNMVKTDTQDSISQDQVLQQIEDSQSQIEVQTFTGKIISNLPNSNNYIKILTRTSSDGRILLKDTDGIEYFTDSQFVTNFDGDDQMYQEEVICCEGDDSSQFQIPKCDGSQLVIEYADDSQNATACNNIKPKCSICLKTFANPNNLKRHMMIHSAIKEFECDICLKQFHQKITMQTHRLTHINPYSCNQCNKTFEKTDALATHKEDGTCNKTKITRVKNNELFKTLKQKITTSTGKVWAYACLLCKKMFPVESAFEQHVESTHKIDPSELICTECGEVLTSKKKRQTHMLLHKHTKNRNMKQFECSVCGKGCSSQEMLVMHERVHSNERPYPCQSCSLRFKTKTHLRLHQLTHTREKQFVCSICMKFFTSKGNLLVHRRTHTGERPYNCSLCGEAFIDSKYLNRHKLKKH